MPAEMIWHICDQFLRPSEDMYEGMRAFNRLSQTNKCFAQIKRDYFARYQQEVKEKVVCFKQEAKKIKSIFYTLSEMQLDYVAHMNLLSSLIQNDDSCNDHNHTMEIVTVLSYLRQKKYNLNTNFEINEHIKELLFVILATQGRDRGEPYYTWYIPRMPLMQACQNSNERLVRLLLKCGCNPDTTYHTYKHENGIATYVSESAFTVAADEKIKELLQNNKKMSSCSVS